MIDCDWVIYFLTFNNIENRLTFKPRVVDKLLLYIDIHGMMLNDF